MAEWLPALVSALLSGAIGTGIGAIITARSTAREKQALANSVDARTPVEVESAAVATMTAALESAQSRIDALVKERADDRAYYEGRITDLESQLEQVRAKLREVELQLIEALRVADSAASGIAALKRRNDHTH